MSLFERKKGKVEYRYFNKGSSGQIYLGPVRKEDPERVRGALDYLNKARDEYLDRAKKLESQLLALLPAEERRRLQGAQTPPRKPLIFSLADKPPTEERLERELVVLSSVIPPEKLEQIIQRIKSRRDKEISRQGDAR